MKNLPWFKIVIILISFGILIVAYINGNKILRYLSDIKWNLSVNSMETVKLNYPKDISKIFISGTDFPKQTTIENTENIDTLMSLLKSLELVERKDKKIDYLKSYIDLGTLVPSSEAQGNYGSHIVLSEDYIFVFPSNYENLYKTYYVKDNKMSFKDGDNEIIQYLKNLA